MLRSALAIVAIATAVGILMPGRSGKEAGNESAAAAEPWFASDGSVTVESAGSSGRSGNEPSGGEVRLTRKANGHFYADVEVNGVVVEFMIDTGATGIAMTEEDARRSGVSIDPSERSYVGEGAGGALTGKTVTLDRVRLGPRSASDMDAVVIDGASTNLLGQSFLSKFSEVNVRGDVMTLR